MLDNYISLFGLNLRIYSLLLLAGVFSIIEFSKISVIKKHPHYFNKEKFDNMAIIIVISGLIAARIWFVFSALPFFIANPLEIFKVWKGGIGIQGSLVGIFLATRWYLKKNKINLSVWTILEDVLWLGLLAQAFGRWGNFYNQEVFGKITTLTNVKYIIFAGVVIQALLMLSILRVDKLFKEKDKKNIIWVIRFLGSIFYLVLAIRILFTPYGQSVVNHMVINQQVRVPLFIIEGTLSMLAFVGIWYYNKNRINSIKAPMYLIAHGGIRASLELLRDEQYIMRFGPIPVTVVLSLIFVIIGIYLIKHQKITT